MENFHISTHHTTIIWCHNFQDGDERNYPCHIFSQWIAQHCTPLPNPVQPPPEGLPRDTNAAKESFCLLNLLFEVKNVSTALGQFKSTKGEKISYADNKHSEMMVESLELIYSSGRHQVGKTSTVKYLQKS